MKDMLDNSPNISIQERYVRLGEKRYPLKMENCVLIQTWCPSDVRYVQYTEQKLRTLHRTFDHTSVKALRMLLELANGTKIEKNIVQTPGKMKEDFTVFKKTPTAPHSLK